MKNLEKFNNESENIELLPLADGRIVEMHLESQSQKIKDYLIRNEKGEIIKFADLNFNKVLHEEIKNSCLEKGIVLKNEELEKITEKKADAMLNEIDEDESTEN